ncbi:hypothetical protein DVH24_038464 [Malus domestica]|uniref:Uncharacterized protein n=1 Tax=Malus domestica TaxID=3750 RepID=A0A498K7G3_MALDO|nr:hypothetical protein DVH24_038464 [Malus domestica]
MKAMPIYKDDENSYDYIEDFFIAKYYKHSNAFPIYPIPNFGKPDIDGVEEIGVEPPLTKNILGGQSL